MIRSMPVLLGAVAMLAFGGVAGADTYTVTNTGDTGTGSLRQAIIAANGHAGPDTIAFNVTGAGCSGSSVCTITLASQLPTVSDTVLINGYTQPDSSPNTNAQGAINAVLKVVVSGVIIPGAQGLILSADGSVVRGLVLNGGFSYTISSSGSNNAVRGCFIGVNASGTTAVANDRGVYCSGSDGFTIGGPLPADRNLISGNSEQNVWLTNCLDPTVQGNLIGTNASGTAATGGGFQAGLLIAPARSGTVVRGNVVSGNAGHGMSFGTGSDTSFGAVVEGNFIGTDVAGAVNLGNGRNGIDILTKEVAVGDVAPGQGNVIAFNGGAGVWVAYAGPTGTRQNPIRGNSIYENGARSSTSGSSSLGIDLDNNTGLAGGLTLNDLGDVDTGPNDNQNFPLILSAVPSGGSTTIQGRLNSLANTTFAIDFYSNPACVGRPQGFLEGRTYLGTANVTTNGSGNATINAVLPVAIAAGSPVTATATDPDGNTSEFSQRIVVSANPRAGSPAGAPFTLSGFNFLPGAAVTVGGVAASNVVVTNFNQITATSPARPPGSLNDITVTNTDGTTGTLPNGWVANFTDVSGGHPFNSFVTKLVANGITAGVGGGLYGVDQPVTRAQMAVFLLRGKYGLCFTPPPATGTVFGDVAANSFAAAWIEELADQGVTAGCGGGDYCPGSPVTRAQMAVFLLRTLNGPTYTPPPCTTPTFGDVPCSNGFAPWIEELVERGITAGCGGGNYCPGSFNTRGQMSVFISTTFRLP